MERELGYYEVCHPYSMTEKTKGYWDGKWWRFYNDIRINSSDGGMFDDDDLQWINETVMNI